MNIRSWHSSPFPSARFDSVPISNLPSSAPLGLASLVGMALTEFVKLKERVDGEKWKKEK